jgi:hypothetical protein
MSRRNKNRQTNQNHKKATVPTSKRTKDLEKQTGHGFQEFKNLQELDKFFRSDPDSVPLGHFEPPLFKKASKADLSRSQGKRK